MFDWYKIIRHNDSNDVFNNWTCFVKTVDYDKLMVLWNWWCPIAHSNRLTQAANLSLLDTSEALYPMPPQCCTASCFCKKMQDWRGLLPNPSPVWHAGYTPPQSWLQVACSTWEFFKNFLHFYRLTPYPGVILNHSCHKWLCKMIGAVTYWDILYRWLSIDNGGSPSILYIPAAQHSICNHFDYKPLQQYLPEKTRKKCLKQLFFSNVKLLHAFYLF